MRDFPSHEEIEEIIHAARVARAQAMVNAWTWALNKVGQALHLPPDHRDARN